MSEETEKGELICVSDGDKQFVGFLKWPEVDDVRKAVTDRRAITLEEARTIRELTIPRPQGIQVAVQIMPYSICRGGVTLRVLPRNWFFPEGADKQNILKLIEQCRNDETRQRAEAAGITLQNNVSPLKGL